MVWHEIRALWTEGLEEYISDLWNIVDFITNMFYVLWFALRTVSWFLTWVKYFLQNKLFIKNIFFIFRVMSILGIKIPIIQEKCGTLLNQC